MNVRMQKPGWGAALMVVAAALVPVAFVAVRGRRGTGAWFGPPNLGMNNKNKTSKENEPKKQHDLESVSPTGHEEVIARNLSQEKGTADVPEIKNPEPQEERKEQEPEQPLNPKRTKNSPPE
jgi:hypothetical protein